MTMSDVRAMLDRKFLYAFDLQGKDCTVEIERVVQGEVTSAGGAKKMPMIHFKGKTKPLGVNITNINTIGALLGTFEAAKWVGHKITIYPTTTKTKEGMVDCIRVRNKLPASKPALESPEGFALTPPNATLHGGG
jgi:hypothetical protein